MFVSVNCYRFRKAPKFVRTHCVYLGQANHILDHIAFPFIEIVPLNPKKCFIPDTPFIVWCHVEPISKILIQNGSIHESPPPQKKANDR